MTKVYHIEDNTKGYLNITIKEYEDEAIIHIILDDELDDTYSATKTNISIDKYTARDS